MWGTNVALNEILDDYAGTVAAWAAQVKRELAAVQKLEKAVVSGNLRDVEKLRLAARAAGDDAQGRAEACEPMEVDAAAYLAPGGAFLPELLEAAERAGVRLFERDGVIFSYPVLVRVEPDLTAVRIDKVLDPTLRPSALAAILKRLQARDPKSRPERFVETLLEAYELVRAKANVGSAYIDLPLADIYNVLTLMPGSEREYTLLDFTRDVYFLDTSDVRETRRGYQISLPASTATREKKTKLLPFVDRNGQEKLYATIKFTPPVK
jgi:hypothetical protein